jgi:hypothetical protein
MPAPISQSVRQALWNASLSGSSTAELASRFSLCARTVRHLLCCFRNNDGVVASPDYPRLRPADPSCVNDCDDLFLFCLRLKQQHPTWGARYLLGVLSKTFPGRDLPSERTLRRWLCEDNHQDQAPAGRKSQYQGRVQLPHQRWQIDACDQMKLASGQQVSWLRGVDECTSTVLGTVVFPPRAIQPSPAVHGPTGLPQVV